jgi:hypothetical protein
MKQLAIYFGDDTANILMRLRIRRQLQQTAAQLVERKSILETQVREFKDRHGADAKAARKNLAKVNQHLKKATDAESQMWANYDTTSSQLSGFLRCVLTCLESVFQQRPGVTEMCEESRKCSVKWRTRLDEVIAARQEANDCAVRYRTLVSAHDSDQFAIKQIETNLERIHTQLNIEELKIASAIRHTARSVSYATLARKCTIGLELDEALIEDIFQLRKVLNRLDALRAMHAISFAESDSRLGAKSIEKAVSQGFQEQSLTFNCEVRVMGTGSADGSNGRQQPADQASRKNTRISFSDALQLERKLLMSQWTSNRVGMAISAFGVSQFGSAIADRVEKKASPLVMSLESKEAALMQRISTRLFSLFSN